MKRPRRFLTQQNILWAVIGLVTSGLLLFRIGSLVGAASGMEVTMLPSADTIKQIILTQPLYLPLYLVRLVVTIPPASPGFIYTRGSSAVLGLIAALLMYWLLRTWYGYRLAVFGTLLMVTAPWFLHLSRLATFNVTFLFADTVLLCLAAVWHQKNIPAWALYASAVALSISLYVPGCIWLAIGIAAFDWKNITRLLLAHKKHAVIAGVFGLVCLLPLVHALIMLPALYRFYLAIPAVLPEPLTFLRQAGDSWRYLFIGGYMQPAYNLGALPIVDALSALSFVVGVYLYSKHPRAVRTRQIAAAWLIGTVICGLLGTLALGYLLPIVVILATGGIGYLLHLWLKVFPRNPLARSFGIGLMGLVIIFAVAYNLRNYYVAWPHNGDTQAVFRAKQ